MQYPDILKTKSHACLHAAPVVDCIYTENGKFYAASVLPQFKKGKLQTEKKRWLWIHTILSGSLGGREARPSWV